MDEDVQPPPDLRDACKDRLERAGLSKVEWQEQGGLERLGQRLDLGFGFVIEIGDRQIGAEFAEGLGAAIGDGMLVGDADNQGFGALKNGLRNIFLHKSVVLLVV